MSGKIYRTRDFINQHLTEYVDPFNGALHIQSVDLFLPGNGGFDLKLIRSYRTNTIVNPAAEPATLAGVGWTVHFGRVLMKGSSTPCPGALNRSVTDNPVIELPDGSQHILFRTGQTSPFYLSTQRWRADCIGSSGFAVFSPDGTRYEMTKQVLEVGAPMLANQIYGWYTTRIEDRNGNYAVVNYNPTGPIQINSVQANSVHNNDPRSITVTHLDPGQPTRRIHTVTGAPGQTYTYEYEPVPNTLNRYFLRRVIRPDGPNNTAWQYEYYPDVSPSPGSFLMRAMTYPQGGRITYEYQRTQFGANQASLSTTVSRKTSSDGGVWQFRFTPSTGFNVFDLTEVTTPGGVIRHRHWGANTIGAGAVWRIGLLREKDVDGIHIETYDWEGQTISNELNQRPGAFGGLWDEVVNAPLLVRRTINRNGQTYTTTYPLANFDAFGNPTSVIESGPNGGNRTTNLTYFINAAKWIIQQVKDETTVGVGTIIRTFDNNGNLESETRDGVLTRYAQFSPPTGDPWQIISPRGFVTTLSDYYRGIPRLEQQPETVEIRRQVSEAGNVESETDGELRTRSYQYDALNRLRQITLPAGNDPPLNPTVIDWLPTRKTASRGGLVQTTDYDGFGRVISVTRAGITTAYRYDPLGRMTFQSYPGMPNVGTSFAYDLLGRLLQATHPNNAFRRYTYAGSNVDVRDERGFVSTYRYRAYGDPDKRFLIGVTAPVASASVSIERNGRDLVTRITQDGVTRTYGYDARYYLVCETQPELNTAQDCATNPTTGETRYGRDEAGNMTSRRVGSSPTTTYAYDGRNRLTHVNYPITSNPAAPGVVRTYSRTDKLRSIASANGVTRTIDYDLNDNVRRETLMINSFSWSAVFRTNGNEHLETITYPQSGQTIGLNPDVLGRPRAVGTYVTQVTYWPSDQVNQITYGNGVTTTFGQDARLRPSTMVTRTGATVHRNQSYAYDDVSNLRTISDTTDSGYNRTFDYDGINRLTVANGPWGNGAIAYRGNGNIESLALGSILISYTYDVARNRLASTGGARVATYGYDVYGNIATRGAETFAYDDAGNLRCYNCGFSNRNEYAYDGNNNRVWARRGGVDTYEFWTLSGQLLAEFTPSAANRLTEYFYLDGKRIAQRTTDARIPTTLTLSASSTSVRVGQNVTLTASVTGGAPTGVVKFREDGQILGSIPLAGSSAALTLSFGTPGTRQIVADYRGDATTRPSTSAPIVVNVTEAPVNTTMTITSSHASPSAATCVTISATISGCSPTGSATLSYTAAKSPQTVPVSNGVAVFSARKFPAGTHLLTVSYSGDARNNPSTGQATLNVTPLPEGWVGINPPCGTWRVVAASEVAASRTGSGPISATTSVSTTGGVAPFTYTWTRVAGSSAISVSGAQTATFSADIGAGQTLAATYRLTVQDATGDSGSQDVAVTFTSVAPLAASVSPSPLTGSRTGPGSVTRSATAAATGGSGGYTYAWTQLSGSTFTISGANTPTITLTGYAFADWCESIPAEGLFRVTVTDVLGQVTSRDLAVYFSASPSGRPIYQCP